MAHQLLLNLARKIPAQLGFGLTHRPGDVAAHLTGENFWIEPFTGFAGPIPTWGALATWPVATGYFTTAQWALTDETGPTWSTCQAYTASGVSWNLTSSSYLPHDRGFILGLIPYDGTQHFGIEWGGGYSLDLLRTGALLSRNGRVLAVGELFDRTAWSGEPLWLHVYGVGRRLCVRALGRDGGLTALGDGFELAGTVYPWHSGHLARISGYGRATWCLAQEAFTDGDFWFEHAAIRMARASTQAPTASARYLGTPISVTVAVEDESGTPIPGGSAQDTFVYRVTVNRSLASDAPVWVTETRVRFAPTWTSNGASSSDVTAHILGESGVTERLSLDPAQTQVGCTLTGPRGHFAAVAKPNVFGRWLPEGTQRVEFYGGDVALTEGRGSRDHLEITGEGPWKRLASLRWPGGRSFAGMTLQAAYQAVLSDAGVTDVSVTAGAGYTLPDEEPGEPALFDFRGEQTVADILLYLRDQFSSLDLIRFEPDGTLVIEERPDDVVEDPDTSDDLTFVFTTSATDKEDGWSGTERTVLQHVARGTSRTPRIIGTGWVETTHQDRLVNDVVVVGADALGQPLLATAVDWPSMTDDTADNWVGERRQLIIIDGGLTTQAVVNWVCRQVYQRLRRLPRVARFRGTHRPELAPGLLVAIDGKGIWRITEMTTSWSRHGVHGWADYTVEYERAS